MPSPAPKVLVGAFDVLPKSPPPVLVGPKRLLVLFVLLPLAVLPKRLPDVLFPKRLPPVEALVAPVVLVDPVVFPPKRLLVGFAVVFPNKPPPELVLPPEVFPNRLPPVLVFPAAVLPNKLLPVFVLPAVFPKSPPPPAFVFAAVVFPNRLPPVVFVPPLLPKSPPPAVPVLAPPVVLFPKRPPPAVLVFDAEFPKREPLAGAALLDPD